MDPRPRLPDPTALVAALMSMMTRFSCLGCPRLAGRIRRSLALLQHYPDDEMSPPLKQLAARLEREWAQLQFAISDHPDHADRNDHPAALPAASQSLH
ncbi:MAG: hypothetical protein H3C26_13410 [Rhodocyclaceae bacterium]|nr:hypothetical protein [Rhodocyclaceae bacterium]